MITPPNETLAKAKELLRFAYEKGWDEEDLYVIAKIILAHYEE
ncbi:hypothetical protein GFC30_3202 (plasmid) [Anoxybacillus amylolyticus]|uniref:Uncharacterized protein n=1 Tax=Anoxybacteroides amylolyticum TaxID=294699 RepID=A0A160F8A1_9BACL|nr:hypothetical protein GFC30_3202 [Anoxybacillus amylolyticus]